MSRVRVSAPRAIDGGHFATLNARTLAREVQERARARADAKDVDVIVYSPSCSLEVQPEAFTQALLELLENAIEATRRGHPVVMDVTETPEGDLLWQIQDAGQGGNGGNALAAQAAFKRARRAIEAQGGTLQVESAPGVGTTVSIWLPANAGMRVASRRRTPGPGLASTHVEIPTRSDAHSTNRRA